MIFFFFFFFFFQAEDGIRDLTVTGVQTCALPISQTQDGETPQAEEYLQSFAYVDGLGRTCVTLAETDPSEGAQDRKSTRLNSSHSQISYAVFCLNKKSLLTPKCSA